MSLRNYRDPRKATSLSATLGLKTSPNVKSVTQFMVEGATDSEILSKFPHTSATVIKHGRQAAIQSLRAMQKMSRGRVK